MRRFNFSYIPDIGSSFEADQEHIQHLLRVLRIHEGDLIEATDGSGYVYELQTLSTRRTAIVFRVLSKNKGQEVALSTTAFISELKHDAMDQSISILAEHGVQNIIPFFSDYSNSLSKPKDPSNKQLRRQKIASESIKKVGGLYSCTIHNSLSFKEIESCLSPFLHKILFWEEEQSSSSNLSVLNFSAQHAVLIGPEGGFSPKEISALKSWGCNSYSLGTKILRAPQAAAAAITLIRYFTENTSL